MFPHLTMGTFLQTLISTACCVGDLFTSVQFVVVVLSFEINKLGGDCEINNLLLL